MQYWIGVVSLSHVQIGVQGGFAQVCHGKSTSLQRMQKGDWFIYYSPKTSMLHGQPLQKFTAIGRVSGDIVYRFSMSPDFQPFRRDIAYVPCTPVSILSLREKLECISGMKNWGYLFRRGHFEISQADFRLIANAMGVHV